MTKRAKPQRSKKATRSRILASRWKRLSYEKTVSTGGLRLFRSLIGGGFVSFAVSAPCTDRDVAEQIALNSVPVIPIDLLSAELSEKSLSKGRTMFGSPWKYLDRIAESYPNLFWWISEKGLRMEVLPKPEPRIPTFDQVAGKLMFEARERCLKTGPLAKIDYKAITDQLEDFRPLEHLPKEYRKQLALWNQSNQKRPIRTFSEAMETKRPPWLRRQVMRRLYRAEEKFRLATQKFLYA